MRYVPNLIPPEVKVLPGYFKGSVYAAKPVSPLVTIVLWIAAVLFFLFAMGSLPHVLPAVFFAAIGLILLPPGKRFVERKLRFRMKPAIRNMAAAVLLVFAIPLGSHYAAADAKAAVVLKSRMDKEATENAAAIKAAQDKKDSLLFYLREAVALGQSSGMPAATKKIDYAAQFAISDSDKTLISKARTQVVAAQLFAQVKAGNYASALPAINDLISTDPDNTELLYQRAVCYSKTGHTADAVHDLAPLVAAGNTDAIELHDKINPLTKHVAYYTTRCRDGSSSSSKGSGACSHHGGVANWNEPVYETSRKY